MLNLLSAGFVRLAKSRLFWLFIAAETAWSAFLAWLFYRFGDILQNPEFFLFLPIFYLCAVEAVFCGLFIGVDYSEGAVRNKIAIGKTRAEVYISNLAVCGFAEVAMLFTHAVVFLTVGFILTGADIFARMVFVKLCCAVLTSLAYASLFTMISMNLSRASTAVAVNIFIAVCMTVSGFFAFAIYNEPKNLLLTPGLPHPAYACGAARAVFGFFEAVLPSSAALEVLSHGSDYHFSPEFLRVMLCSLAASAAFTIIGLWAFRRKNIN